jgi:prepilin-type N-terminal cleavage/methylation domain-containing protein
MKKKLGFTLIELLVVIGIIAALTAVVFVAIDPAKRFRDSRNARRTSDADTILGAVHQYIVDTGGSMPSGIGNSTYQIGTCTTGAQTLCPLATGTSCVDIGATLGSNKYLKSNPIDPQSGTAATTGYSIAKDANNLFTINACLSEGTSIAISR